MKRQAWIASGAFKEVTDRALPRGKYLKRTRKHNVMKLSTGKWSMF